MPLEVVSEGDRESSLAGHLSGISPPSISIQQGVWSDLLDRWTHGLPGSLQEKWKSWDWWLLGQALCSRSGWTQGNLVVTPKCFRGYFVASPAPGRTVLTPGAQCPLASWAVPASFLYLTDTEVLPMPGVQGTKGRARASTR